MTRIAPPAEDTFLKGTYAYSRRRYGKVLEPLLPMGHSKKLVAGYGAFETAIDALKSMDEKLLDLAVMKVAAVVGCEWCLDFGSDISLKHGVTEEQLRELPRYRESDAFTEDE